MSADRWWILFFFLLLKNLHCFHSWKIFTLCNEVSLTKYFVKATYTDHSTAFWHLAAVAESVVGLTIVPLKETFFSGCMHSLLFVVISWSLVIMPLDVDFFLFIHMDVDFTELPECYVLMSFVRSKKFSAMKPVNIASFSFLLSASSGPQLIY